MSKLKSPAAPAESLELTPRQLVAELDRHVIGQAEAKRAVAIALRNRWRRQRLPADMRRDVAPKNILMIGPTGVGKTEIARRLARLTGAPFVKVEATKYTEVGYYGRDVESMVRDLAENAVNLVRARERARVEEEAKSRAENRLLGLLNPPVDDPFDMEVGRGARTKKRQRASKLREMLRAGELEERRVEISVESRSTPMLMGGIASEQMDLDLQNMLERIMPRQNQRREVSVAEAREILLDQEVEAMLDPEKINAAAIDLAENLGIIFVDEIDKIVASNGLGPDVSRQGVQRDLLPLVEGATVQTRYGHVSTDHVLFIAAGAFHNTKPSDLMPELQGRFPIRVELGNLTQTDFARILREPKNSLTRQYQALMETEGLRLEFTDDAIDALADYAHRVNQTTQNIGARRLYTILERLLEEISFEAPDRGDQKVVIDGAYVNQRLKPVTDDEDVSKFML